MSVNQSQADVLKSLLDAEQDVQDTVNMPRFNAEFIIRALDGKDIDRIQDQCTFYKGKGSKRVKEIDEQKFGSLLIVKACVVPNWNAQELKDKYETHDASEVVKKRLLAGEISKLAAAIMEVSGYTDEEGEEEALEEVKN
jgi:hypothetical protein